VATKSLGVARTETKLTVAPVGPVVFRRLVGLVVGIIALLLSTVLPEVQSATSQACVLVLAWAGCAIVCWRGASGVGGASTAYVAVFGVFHTGLVLAFALGGDSALVGGGDNRWISSELVNPAIVAVCAAFTGLTLGTIVGALLPRTRALSIEGPVKSPPRIDQAGGIAVVLGLILVGKALLDGGGIGVLFSGYGQFLEAVSGDGMFGYGVVLLGMGTAFLVSSGGRARQCGWWVMLGIAVVGLPLGMRGTILFPLTVLIVIEAKSRRLPLLPFLGLGYLALASISVLRQTRVDGIGGLLSGGWTDFLPLHGLAEMGYSLYPTVVVQNWMASGLEPMNGITYFAPLVRFVEGIFLGGAPAAESDYRLFNVEVANRVGQIGGSPVAEGLRNGGMVGMVILMTIIGLLIAYVDRLPNSPFYSAVTAIVLLPLLIGVRNSFAPTLSQWMIGGLLLLLAAGLRTAQTKERGIRGV